MKLAYYAAPLAMIGVASQPCVADVVMTWHDSKLDVAFSEEEAVLLSENSQNVNQTLGELTKQGFMVAMTKGWGLPLGPQKGATMLELIKREERILLIQRLYSGKTAVVRVTRPDTALVLRGN